MPAQTTTNTTITKKELLKMRDCRIVEEFYHLYEVKRLRMDDVLYKLSVEMFYLNPSYIYKRIFSIEGNRNYYDQLVRSHKKNQALS